jgi:hypothetical protein
MEHLCNDESVLTIREIIFKFFNKNTSNNANNINNTTVTATRLVMLIIIT